MVAEEILVGVAPDVRVVGPLEEQWAHQRPGSLDRSGRLFDEIRHEALAELGEPAVGGQDARVSGALGDVPGGSVSRRPAMIVELRVVFHDRAEGGHRRPPQEELGVRDLAREAGQVPAPEEDAAGGGGQACRDRCPEGGPARHLVTRPMTRRGASSGETRPAEGHGLPPGLAQQAVVRALVEVGEPVVRPDAGGPVRIPQACAPGMLAPIGLEAVDPDLVDEVAALREPPVNGLLARPVREQGAGKPPTAIPIGTAVCLANHVATLERDLAIGARLAAR